MCPFATACSILLSLNLLDSPTPDDVRAYQQAAAAVGRDAVRTFAWPPGANPMVSSPSGTSTWRSLWRLTRTIRVRTAC